MLINLADIAGLCEQLQHKFVVFTFTTFIRSGEAAAPSHNYCKIVKIRALGQHL